MTRAPKIIALSKSDTHSMTKPNHASVTLIENFGIEGDVHAGKTVKHRYLVLKKKDAPNLRQVHLVHSELFDELATEGFAIKPGMIGENVTTQGIDLLHLPSGTILHLGKEAQVKITGLREPCKQLNGVQSGLLKAVISRDADGNLFRKTGVMSVVIAGGEVFANDTIRVEYPPEPFLPLVCV
ncbi:MAG: MOSC domain-containing protein [Bacteroidetes bacterium]|jgi:MOSC domain-containing protein YiiM|nr:MOSC domain-containing protein [Bacteroidota bacterium]